MTPTLTVTPVYIATRIGFMTIQAYLRVLCRFINSGGPCPGPCPVPFLVCFPAPVRVPVPLRVPSPFPICEMSVSMWVYLSMSLSLDKNMDMGMDIDIKRGGICKRKYHLKIIDKITKSTTLSSMHMNMRINRFIFFLNLNLIKLIASSLQNKDFDV
jgi:hypothetical protein